MNQSKALLTAVALLMMGSATAQSPSGNHAPRPRDYKTALTAETTI